MRIDLSDFRGQFPRIADEVIPNNAATVALNCRLVSGRLEAWKNFRQVETLCKLAPINTIYPLRDPATGNVGWLHWRTTEIAQGATNVDVAKSIIAGDATARVYLTGLDIPRWTDWQLATTGTGCFPIQTRPLGVPAPLSPPSLSGAPSSGAPISVNDDFENDSGWTFSPIYDDGASQRIARRLATGGNPNGRLQFIVGNGQSGDYAYRDFGIGSSANVRIEFDYRLDQKFADQYPTENLWLPKDYQWFTVAFMCDQSGNGPRITWEANEPPPSSSVTARVGSSWGQMGSVVSRIATDALPPLGQWVRVVLSGSKQALGTYTWRVQVFLGSTAIIDQELSGISPSGGFVGFSIGASSTGHGAQVCSIDNLLVSASAPATDTSDDVTTSYVFTFVSQVGSGFEESAPSPPSALVVRDDGTTITVTTPTTPPSGVDYNIVSKRIYRAVTSASSTDYYLVAEIPLSQASYDDNVPDRVLVLGSILRTADWDLPPGDLRGILALPNGIMAGFRRNELCLSEQGFPHAWPVKYRLATDFDIVGIGAIDTMIVICTQGFPYLAAGNSPGSYSMMKIEVPQACVSKRSIAYVAGIGVVYASPDGLVAVSGPGRAAVITEKLFSRREWQKLNPESIIATAHDNRYFAFYDTGSAKGGMILDFSEAQLGVTMLSFHASAVVSDLLDDRLYLVLDYYAAPAPPGSPAQGQVTPDGRTLFAFDDYQSGPLNPLLPYVWRSKRFVMPYPTSFRYARVEADSFQDITVRLFDGDAAYASVEVQSDREFVLPVLTSSDGARNFSVEVYGTASVTSIHVAEDSSEVA